MGIGSRDYSHPEGSNVSWNCFKCNTTNLDSFTFHSYTFNDSSSNYFFPLSDQNLSSKSQSPPNLSNHRSRHRSNTSNSSVFRPLKSSTPHPKKNNTHNSEPSSETSNSRSNVSSFSNTNSIPYSLSKKQNLRIMTFNAQSIKNKTSEFKVLLDYCKPDIVCCAESWLEGKKSGENPTIDWIKDSEIFPSNYKVFRHDRTSKGGGVFILIEKSLIAVEKPMFVTECEINWVKLHLKGRKEMFIGCFYMPHRNKEDLHQLDLSLKERI